MRHPKAPALDPDNPHSAVYMAARREWNERAWQGYIAQAHAWRLTALAAIGVAFVAVAGVAWIGACKTAWCRTCGADGNRLGDALAISRADIAPPADPRLIRSQLARWVDDVRTVYIDVEADKLCHQRSLRDGGSQCGERAGTERLVLAQRPVQARTIDRSACPSESVLPLSGNTWRVEWREDRHARQGALESSQHWEATITVSINPPTTDSTVLVNPTGLYVESFDWSQRQ